MKTAIQKLQQKLDRVPAWMRPGILAQVRQMKAAYAARLEPGRKSIVRAHNQSSSIIKKEQL